MEQDKLSTYIGLNDYDTLFESRHGRGAIDSVSGESVPAISLVAMPISTTSVGANKNAMIGARPKHAPDS